MYKILLFIILGTKFILEAQHCDNAATFQCFVKESMKILKKEAKSFEQKDIHRVICRSWDLMTSLCPCADQLKDSFQGMRCTGKDINENFFIFHDCFVTDSSAPLRACEIKHFNCTALIDVLHCKQREFEKKCQGAAAFADVTYRKAKFNLENYDVCQNAVLTAFGPVMTSNMGTIIAVILCLLLGAVGASIAFYVYRYRPNSFSSFTALLPFNNS